MKNVRLHFFPLDNELKLLHGQYTPRLQESMTRLGGKLPFKEAKAEIWYAHRTSVPKATIHRTNRKHGQVAERIDREKTEYLERTAPESTANVTNLTMSSDGAFIHLTTGEWTEVKTVSVGELRLGDEKNPAKTSKISYFSRKYGIREFERYALSELHRRGIDNANLSTGIFKLR